MPIIDSYEQFFRLIPKDRFFQFGLENIISIDPEKSRDVWDKLKHDVAGKSQQLFVRSSGRNASGNIVLKKMYKDVFDVDIKFDPTNNAKPTKLIEDCTSHKKNRTIFNYQVSHIFGQTKNVYCFTAPWNIVFIPKIIDPFTGHETMGLYVDEFKRKFQHHIYSIFKEMIDEYNVLMNEYKLKVKEWLLSNVEANDVQTYLKDFEEIIV